MEFPKPMFTTASTLVVLFAYPAGLAAQEAQQPKHELPRYVVKDLGTLGGTVGQGRGINNKDWITGLALLPHNMAFRAFLRKKGTRHRSRYPGRTEQQHFFETHRQGEVRALRNT